MKYRWVSWNHYKIFGYFTLYFPWWVSLESGEDNQSGEPEYVTIVSAIPFKTKILAEQIIYDSFDDGGDKIYQESEYGTHEIWRFNELKEGSPFSERFPKSHWMLWPSY